MGNHTPDAVGVDISKAHLDVHRLNTGEAAQFGNDAAGFEAFAAWIGTSADEVVYESTEPWHRAFEEALVERLPLTRVNALRARRFAQAMGQEAKTDKADAQVLARMGAALPLRRVAPRSATRRDLDELHTARDGLVKDRTAARNRQRQACHRLLKRQLKNRLDQIERQLGALDAEIARLIAADEELSRGVAVPTSIPGIARVTASGLLAEMPELGHLDAKAAASLAGVAPMTRESGQWKGRSFIHGGRARVRRMLYMAALSASRHNPDLARKYEELTTRGKPPKVALCRLQTALAVPSRVFWPRVHTGRARTCSLNRRPAMLSVASTRTCPLCTTGPKSSAIITAPGEKCGLAEVQRPRPVRRGRARPAWLRSVAAWVAERAGHRSSRAGRRGGSTLRSRPVP